MATSLGVDLSKVKTGNVPKSWQKTMNKLDKLGEEKQEEFRRREYQAIQEAQRMITGS